MLDEDDFDKFCECIGKLLKPDDVMWALCGRASSSHTKMVKVVAKHNLKCVTYHLNYNPKQMQQYGYWRRNRGLANARVMESMLLVYKGPRQPKLKKERRFVDQGSLVYVNSIRNVPVLSPKNQAYVSKEVRDESLRAMVGSVEPEDLDDEANSQGLLEDDGLHQPKNSARIMENAVKRRKLYRQVSTDMVQWFPHDNDLDLLKELCHEANRPRWVLHGTPASGAGVHGCLEMGASVVNLCFNEHHKQHLERHLLERAVEAVVSGQSNILQDEDLVLKSNSLNLEKEKKDKKKKADDSDDEEKTKKGTRGRKRQADDSDDELKTKKNKRARKRKADDSDDEQRGRTRKADDSDKDSSGSETTGDA